VFLLERLGNDAHGRAQKQMYADLGIHTDFVYLDETTPTGSAGIFLDEAGQNKIVVVPGANGQVTCSDVDYLYETIRGAKILGAQLEVPLETVDHAIRVAASLGVRTMLDPAPVAPIDETLYPYISIIKPNECEAQSLTGLPVTDTETAYAAAQVLLDKGVREAVIITLGEKGTVLVTHKEKRYFPGIPMKAVDTGGAGDTFAGALLASLAQNWSLEKSVCYAQCASAICVTRTSGFDATEKEPIDALFKKTYPQYTL
jgi:ribokinase